MTSGEKSLRDLLQWMNEHYAKQHLFFPDSQGVEQAAEAITGKSFAEFFRDYVSGVKEIPYDDFFQFVGLHVVSQTVAGRIGGVHHHREPGRSTRSRCRLIPTAMPTGQGSLRETA